MIARAGHPRAAFTGMGPRHLPWSFFQGSTCRQLLSSTPRFIRDGRYQAGTVVVDGTHIAAVGVPAPAAQTVDVGGACILPGFVDTHFHFTSQAVKSSRCDLSAATSAQEVAALLEAFAPNAVTPFVMGVEWDESSWRDPQVPTRSMLDAVSSTLPVLARRICGHIGVVNTVLLDQLPHSDLVDRDSGLVREHAAWEANKLCKVSDDVLAGGVEDAARRQHELGVTGLHDIVEPARFAAYLDGVQNSNVPLAIDVLLHVHPSEFDRYVALAAKYDTPHLRLLGVKCFLDGSLGGRTAALNAPYADADTRGTMLMGEDEVEDIVRGCNERDLTCAMHAIGDQAIDTILNVLERVQPTAGHYRIEHCELTGPAQVERLAKARVYLGMQPNFVRYWGQRSGLYEQRLGPERFARMNCFRTLVDAGVDIIFGSDGMPPGPQLGLPGATAHPIEGERLSLTEAVAAYTSAADAAGAHGREAGAVAPGRRADLVIWDRDPLADEEAKVQATLFGGRFVLGAERMHKA